MAFTRGQVDRFGQAIPASPGYSTIINSDGTQPPMQNIILLDPSIVASDSANSGATLLAVSPSGIPVATESVNGLMSAADKTKLDTSPVIIQKASFAGVSTVASTTWVAETYRRIEIFLRILTGTAGLQNITMGFNAGSYFTCGAYNSATGTWTQNNQFTVDQFAFNMSAVPFQLDIDAQIGNDGGLRTLTGSSVDGAVVNGRYSGASTDTVTGVTGVTFNFAGVSSGRFEIVGHQ